MAAWDRIGTCRKAMSLLGMDKGHLEKKKLLFLLPKAVKKKAPVALALMEEIMLLNDIERLKI